MAKSAVSERPETPFDSIESAQQFVELLCEAIEEARAEIEEQLRCSTAPGEARRRQALQVIAYNLGKLSQHMGASRRILNDLRSLRRLLFQERRLERAAAAGADTDSPEPWQAAEGG